MPIQLPLPTIHTSIWYRASDGGAAPPGSTAWVSIRSRKQGRLFVRGHAPVDVKIVDRRGYGARKMVRIAAEPQARGRRALPLPGQGLGRVRVANQPGQHGGGIATRGGGPRRSISDRIGNVGWHVWLPAVSSSQLAPPQLRRWVVWPGGNSGTLNERLRAPRQIPVVGSRSGGVTGLEVRVRGDLLSNTKIAAQAAPAAMQLAAPDGFTAEMSRQYGVLYCKVDWTGRKRCYKNGFEVPVPAPVENPPAADVGSFIATPSGDLDITGCCIDPETLIITCPGGETQWYMHGRQIPAASVSWTRDEGGNVVAGVINTGDVTFTLDACASGGKEPPVPSSCCYDVATSTLICDETDAFNGMSVALQSMFVDNAGRTLAIVTSPDLPGGVLTLPLCEDNVPGDCCFETRTSTIHCQSSSDYEGRNAGVVTTFTGPDGRPWASLSWPGGGARMPICDEPCPGFCCVNLDSGTWVCPEDPTRNGQPVVVTQVVNDAGYRWALLEGGGRVPVCGTDCPPPQLCPDCPGCPPGMWMSPDGSCTDPPPCEECPPPRECPPPQNCPTCPDGYLLDTRTGRCVRCPPGWTPPDDCPPWWELQGDCCEECALGQPCPGEAGGCNCSEVADGRVGNPGRRQNRRGNPDAFLGLKGVQGDSESSRSRQKVRSIFSARRSA